MPHHTPSPKAASRIDLRKLASSAARIRGTVAGSGPQGIRVRDLSWQGRRLNGIEMWCSRENSSYVVRIAARAADRGIVVSTKIECIATGLTPDGVLLGRQFRVPSSSPPSTPQKRPAVKRNGPIPAKVHDIVSMLRVGDRVSGVVRDAEAHRAIIIIHGDIPARLRAVDTAEGSVEGLPKGARLSAVVQCIDRKRARIFLTTNPRSIAEIDAAPMEAKLSGRDVRQQKLDRTPTAAPEVGLNSLAIAFDQIGGIAPKR